MATWGLALNSTVREHLHHHRISIISTGLELGPLTLNPEFFPLSEVTRNRICLINEVDGRGTRNRAAEVVQETKQVQRRVCREA